MFSSLKIKKEHQKKTKRSAFGKKLFWRKVIFRIFLFFHAVAKMRLVCMKFATFFFSCLILQSFSQSLSFHFSYFFFHTLFFSVLISLVPSSLSRQEAIIFSFYLLLLFLSLSSVLHISLSSWRSLCLWLCVCSSLSSAPQHVRTLSMTKKKTVEKMRKSFWFFQSNLKIKKIMSGGFSTSLE